jgi:hypothetical protein
MAHGTIACAIEARNFPASGIQAAAYRSLWVYSRIFSVPPKRHARALFLENIPPKRHARALFFPLKCKK